MVSFMILRGCCQEIGIENNEVVMIEVTCCVLGINNIFAKVDFLKSLYRYLKY